MKVLILCLVLTGASVDSLDPATGKLDPLAPAISDPLQTSDQLAPAIAVCYTQWFDMDDPTGMGDFETLPELRAKYPGQICNTTLGIQAATLSGLSPQSIPQNIQWYDTTHGFACRNDMQINGQCCLDYKVRFKCPCPWP